MSESRSNPTDRSLRLGRWKWFGAAFVLLAMAGVLVGEILISHREPILRERVIETLVARFEGKVELETFQVSLAQGLQVSGSGLKIFGDSDPNNHEPGIQPIIGVAEFKFRIGILNLFRSPMHVDTVYVKGLSLNLPPRRIGRNYFRGNKPFKLA